ncbi:MAG: glycosyltransferase, partial [Rhodobacteraceae bacterium]|nr:glycosyltransferase [Paracoccaceae bacterium]
QDEKAKGLRGAWLRMKFVRSLVRELKPDLVVSFLTKINTLTLLATIGQNVPVVISERNNPRAQKAHPAWYHAQNIASIRAKAFVLLTQDARKDLPRWTKHQAVVIPNPCPPVEGTALRPIGDCREIVAVGRLEYQKGFDMLISAFSEIHQARPKTRLTIFGEGPDRAGLQAQIDNLNLTGSVSMPGIIGNPGAWQRLADLVLVTSRYEGFCNVLAEASVSGIPLVSFDCDYGPRSLIRNGENGILVPAGDVRALSNAALNLIDDLALRKKMRGAVATNRAMLEPTQVLAKWDEVIERAADASVRSKFK